MTNWLALIVAAVSALAVGFVWYNPKVFGTAWMKEVGMTEEDAQKGTFGSGTWPGTWRPLAALQLALLPRCGWLSLA